MTRPCNPFRRSNSAAAALATLGATASLLCASPGLAQGNQAAQRVEITGSNIRRADTETASPVQTVTRQDIEKSGKSTVAEFLQTLAADNQGSVPMSHGRGFAGSSASGISLRGLGAQSTLVLVNGRRVAPHGLADDGQKAFVDLNMIPAEAVERIEILKDGASAIYGSDAIAGVVNVVLRKNFAGTVAKVSYGESAYGDGGNTRASITHGFGDLQDERYNVVLNLEVARKGEIDNRDRAGRARVGRFVSTDIGFAPTAAIAATANAGGTGLIATRADGTLVNNSATNSIVGNVRNPSTLNYYSRSNPNGVGFTRSFPNANCAALTGNFPHGDPGGGCVFDQLQAYGQVQPKSDTVNFFGRFARQVDTNLQAYAELSLYGANATSARAPTVPSGTIYHPGGVVSSATVALGAAHPDNPYFGSVARVRYLPADVGALVLKSETKFTRLVAGVTGSFADWDYDSAITFSQSKTHQKQHGTLDRLVAYALLNPSAANVAAATASSAAYAALPASTYWRIGENAGLNSAAMYAALSPTIERDGQGRNVMLDLKATRELGRLDGGPIGLALGAEVRREALSLDPFTNFLKANTIGAGYSIYDGQRSVAAAYGEVLLPVSKALELSGALRLDHYSDAGTSFTPKLGAKFTAARNLALRATYAQGFRAPHAPENGANAGFAQGSSGTNDPLRCALGVPGTCDVGGAAAVLAAGNPELKPEKSRSMTLGLVWDVTPTTSLTVDYWGIRRSNEIVTENLQQAVNANHVIRDPNTATSASDPGAITAILANYINAARTTVRGIDLDAKTRVALGEGRGRLTLNASYTHLFTWQRRDPDGTAYEYAGTHGNCDVTNCMGTPQDRVNLGATWDIGAWRWAAIANHRGSLSNKLYEQAPSCANALADGTDAPAGCKLASFTTVDLSLRWQFNRHTEVSASVQNVLDAKPPFDPLTYGAVGYNPLDQSGAVGRFFTLGLRHMF